MFFIYDNESTDNLKEILKLYIEDGVVIYAYVKGTGMQYPVYNECIVNPQKVKFCYHPHFFVYRFGEKCVDINKVPTDFYFTKHNSRDVLRVNHYYTKSKEEYLEKINREMADFKNAKRKEINLADLNFPNGVEDYTALKFLPALKKRMEDI